MKKATTTASVTPPDRRRPSGPGWLLGLGPLVLIAVLMALFALRNGPGLAKLSEGHNTTEGLSIVTPLAKVPARLGSLAVLGLIAAYRRNL